MATIKGLKQKLAAAHKDLGDAIRDNEAARMAGDPAVIAMLEAKCDVYIACSKGLEQARTEASAPAPAAAPAPRHRLGFALAVAVAIVSTVTVAVSAVSAANDGDDIA